MVGSITPQELARRLAETPRDLVLLDVREDDEWAIAHLEPSLHIPMAQVEGRVAEIPRDKEVVVYCHHGGRSYAVAAYLEGEGYSPVTNLTGGIDDWARTVDPSMERY